MFEMIKQILILDIDDKSKYILQFLNEDFID